MICSHEPRVVTLKQEIRQPNRRAVQSAKLQFDEVFMIFLTAVRETEDHGVHMRQVEQSLLDSTQLIRGLLGKLGDQEPSGGLLLEEMIDLSGIDNEPKSVEQTMPDDKTGLLLPLIEIDEDDFKTFSQTPDEESRKAFQSIAQDLRSIAGFCEETKHSPQIQEAADSSSFLPDLDIEQPKLTLEQSPTNPLLSDKSPVENVLITCIPSTHHLEPMAEDDFGEAELTLDSSRSSGAQGSQDVPTSISFFIQSPSIVSTQEPGPKANKPREAPKRPAQPSERVDLSDKKIEDIYAKSCSVVNYATNLMLHMFSESELIACSNVYGRCVRQASVDKDAPALDKKRVEIIRRLVEEKVGPDKNIWKTCVMTMNIKIWKLKGRGSGAEKKKSPGSEQKKKPSSTVVIKYPKISEDIRQSPFYAKHNLSYEDINEIYHESVSIANFSKNLMMHLYDLAEIKRCLNVHGRANNPAKVIGPRLDEKRLGHIRHIVQENSNFCKDLWQRCITSMNRKICEIKSLDKSQTSSGQ